ncbi:ankyrin repeat-containing domain protein, partial [Triangularia setosa]
IMKILFLFNLNLDETDRSGRTALHFVGSDTMVETVKLLVGRGFHVNTLDDEGISSLPKALLHKILQVSRYLVLEAGADVNAGIRNPHGSPFRIACIMPGISLDMIKLLVEHGANIN